MRATALFASPAARRALRPGAHGLVLVASETGAYVELGGEVVAVAPPRRPFGPLSLAVSELERVPLRAGVDVAVDRDALRIGGGAVSLERMRVRGGPVSRSACGPGAGGVARAVVAALPSPAPALSPGLGALAAGDLDEAVAALAGLGRGLTPEGDDALAGYAAWRYAISAPVALSPRAAGLASPVGLAYLRCAERGELPGAAARLVAACLAADAAAGLSALTELRRWGSTSGAAVAWGIGAAARYAAVSSRSARSQLSTSSPSPFSWAMK